MTKHESRCPTCIDSPRKGLLPIGKDFVECPDCINGVFTSYEQLITPARHFLMPGMKGI
jgi:hypothetical protein